MKEPVGILAAACHLPARKRTVEELFQQERIALSSEIAARLGIGQVPIRNDKASETPPTWQLRRGAKPCSEISPYHHVSGRCPGSGRGIIKFRAGDAAAKGTTKPPFVIRELAGCRSESRAALDS